MHIYCIDLLSSKDSISKKSKALPMFHAVTGCDTVSSFSAKGKKTAWKTWLSYHKVTSAFHLLSDRPESATLSTYLYS